MTDRKIVYPGAIPLETDILTTAKNAMLGTAELSRSVLGTGTLLDGFNCTANSPAALNVIVNAGRIYGLTNVDATDYGSLLADTTHSTVKQGQFWDAVTLSTPAPATVGFSVVHLVQIALQEQDTDLVVLPYYNAANPSVAYSGPGNTGVAQATNRKCVAVVSIKTGTAATTGTQVTPAPDAGYTGAWTVTVANGQTTVTSAHIAKYPDAPFLTETLTQKAGITSEQNESYRHATATGTSDAITATYSPVYAAWVDGMTFFVKITAINTTTTPTISPNGLTAKTIQKSSGIALVAGDLQIGMIAEFKYSSTLDKVLLQNPATTGEQIGYQVLTATGTYTPTPGTLYHRVEVLGSGGGGASSVATGAGQVACGAGGTAGSYGIGWYPCTGTQAVTIGAGGAAGTAGGAGGTGGTTSFGSLLSITGSAGGQVTVAVAPPILNNGAGGTAGIVTGANVISVSGNRGISGVSFNTTNGQSGQGASSIYGAGGFPSYLSTPAVGNAGSGYGSGGSGGVTGPSGAARNGGQGTQGLIIVWEYR